MELNAALLTLLADLQAQLVALRQENAVLQAAAVADAE
jgi:hypothetical protein